MTAMCQPQGPNLNTVSLHSRGARGGHALRPRPWHVTRQEMA
jgi:hypothetical protein